MASMNVVVLSGNVGSDPEVRTTGSGTEVANFSLAVERYRGKDKESETMWVRCAIWGAMTKLAEYFGKGDRVTIQGQLRINKTDEREYINVDVTDIVLPSRPRESREAPSTSRSKGSSKPPKASKKSDDGLPW